MDSAAKLVTSITGALEPRLEILEAYLFGSHARGMSHAHSDVDSLTVSCKDSSGAALLIHSS